MKDVIMLLSIFNAFMQADISISLQIAKPITTGEQLDEHEYVFNLFRYHNGRMMHPFIFCFAKVMQIIGLCNKKSKNLRIQSLEAVLK